MSAASPSSTVLDGLRASLFESGQYNQRAVAAPVAILWPDEGRHWEPIIPLLRDIDATLLTLGEYTPELRRGPAIWVRALLARQLDAAAWGTDAVPIVYLPGISRGSLRAIESCAKELRPIAELQYRGVFWSQVNAKDWTVYAFLKSPEGLGLQVARDEATLEAMQRALLMLADTPVASLQGRTLEAGDFDDLLAPDVQRDMLRWMNDPKGTVALWSKESWAAFRSRAKDKLSFDPKAEGELGAAERMAARGGDWKHVWMRFAESPRSYPGVVALLEKASPAELALEPGSWPRINDRQEDELRAALTALAQTGKVDAAKKVIELEAKHGSRRSWVWGQLDRSPLAMALQHLAVTADVCSKSLGGATAESMAQSYAEGGWRADDAVLRALATVERGPDVDAVKSAVRAIYEPWMDEAARHLQGLTKKSGYTGHLPANQTTLKPSAGECVLFVDGLRFDLGHRLQERLGARGLKATLSCRWSALPSVTPTGKNAVSPVAELLGGDGEEFKPRVADTGEELTTDRFRKLLAKVGVEYLSGEELGTPSSSAWTEFGDVDSAGHEQGWKLARRVDEQLREVVERIEALVNAGWTKVKIVTDHGWLLLPGGLPKAELPSYLADSKWGRCAALKAKGGDGDQLVVDWRWSSSVRIALAPGICCFRAGLEYTHGGLSLQECVTPMLDVTRGAVAQTATIVEVTWTGLRCRVRVTGGAAGALVEVRSKPADPKTVVSKGAKQLDHQGSTSLVIPDDSLLGAAAVVVLLSDNGTLLAKYPTCIGGEE